MHFQMAINQGLPRVHFDRTVEALLDACKLTDGACPLQAYTAHVESPLLLGRELQVPSQAPADAEGFSLKANSVTREVTATMRVEDGAALEMVIRLPICWPLKTADVDCRRTVSAIKA